MRGSCHCGRVTIKVPCRPPYLNVCNCTMCVKVGGLWGYFPHSRVRVEGATSAYVRADMDDPFLATHFCAGCGCTTHWWPTHADAPDRMGVNMRLFEPDALRGIQVRYGNMRDETEGAPRYYRTPTTFEGVGLKA